MISTLTLSPIMSGSTVDKWGTASAVYAVKVEYVTRPVAEELVSWVDSESPLSTTGVTAFDNGSGTGVVTTVLRTRFPGIPILAGDLSPGMLEVIEKKGLLDVRTQVLDATDLHPLKDNTFTHALSTFMIQFAPDPLQALREMFRVTMDGGTLGLGMWGEFCFDAPWVDACRHFEPNYTYPRTWTSDWSDKERLKTYIQLVGFKDVQMKTIRPRWDFQSPEAFFEFFLESKNPEFERAIRPWWDSGRKSDVKPLFERLVKERYDGAKDFDSEVFLFIARK